MKRLHIHIKTDDLERSVRYYEALFGVAPTRREKDYAKWLLDDPAAHVSLSTHCGEPGVDHVGISVATREALDEIADRLTATGDRLAAEEATTCCYAKSDKYWSRAPQGAVWELFHTFGDSADYGEEPDREVINAAAAAPTDARACCERA